MKLLMMLGTKPTHIQRTAIIIVMSVNTMRAANLARLPD
jgi:hypothetical protein